MRAWGWRRALAALAVAAVGVAGCSGEGGPGEKPAGAVTEEPASELERGAEDAGAAVVRLPQSAAHGLVFLETVGLPDEAGGVLTVQLQETDGGSGAGLQMLAVGSDAALITVNGDGGAGVGGRVRGLLTLESVRDVTDQEIHGAQLQIAPTSGPHMRITLPTSADADGPYTANFRLTNQVLERAWRDDNPAGAPGDGTGGAEVFALRMIPSEFARAARNHGYVRFLEEAGRAEISRQFPEAEALVSIGQQWDCHVLGLPLVDQVDLESWRPDNPRWRSTDLQQAIAQAVVKRDPAALSAACNW